MIRFTTCLMLCAALAVAGCAGRFSDPDALGAGGVGGGPGSASDPTSAAFFVQSVGDRVLFPVDESALNAAARATLDEQARWLSANPRFTAVIEGHADEQGTREYNLALGARRATAARDYLVSRGVASGRLQTVTFGKERPIEVCSTEECYAQNRRAVTVLATGAGA